MERLNGKMFPNRRIVVVIEDTNGTCDRGSVLGGSDPC